MKSINGLDFSCLLPIEIEYNEKLPRKKSFLLKFKNKKINPNCLKQNEIRKNLSKIIPKEMISFEDNEYGIDYYYKGISIDQKFCFGDLGKDTIKIRVREKELLNKSDWTMMINEKEEIMFFKTKKLKEFVKKNWSLVQKNFISNKTSYSKTSYSEYFVKIQDLCKIEKVNIIKTNMNEKKLYYTIQKIFFEKKESLIEKTLSKNKTILDYSKKICFEPFLINIAKQNNYF